MQARVFSQIGPASLYHHRLRHGCRLGQCGKADNGAGPESIKVSPSASPTASEIGPSCQPASALPSLVRQLAVSYSSHPKKSCGGAHARQPSCVVADGDSCGPSFVFSSLTFSSHLHTLTRLGLRRAMIPTYAALYSVAACGGWI